MIYKLTSFKRDPWSGFSTFNFCNVNIAPELTKKGTIATGMNEKEARQLEKDNFLAPGSLREDSPFWDTFFIPFPPTGLELDDEVASDRIKLAVLRCMRKVANGIEEKKVKSKAIYLLTVPKKVDEEDEDKFSIKEDAYGILKDLTANKRKEVYTVLSKEKRGGIIVDADSMTELAIKNNLRRELESNPAFFVQVANDDKLTTKALIIKLVANRIISTVNTGYFRGNDQLAYDLNSMVAYLEDPQYQNMVIQFQQELAAKKK